MSHQATFAAAATVSKVQAENTMPVANECAKHRSNQKKLQLISDPYSLGFCLVGIHGPIIAQGRFWVAPGFCRRPTNTPAKLVPCRRPPNLRLRRREPRNGEGDLSGATKGP